MLQALCRQYIEQFSRAQALARAGLPKDLGRAGLLQKVQENAQEIFALRVSNDELLRQIVLDRRAEDLTPEDVQILIGFADELVSYAIRLDAGIAYRVHKLLYEYARLHDDVDLCVRELYYQGLTLYSATTIPPSWASICSGTASPRCLTPAPPICPGSRS